ncbi:PREDICTED: C-type lectin domain family 10 member A-like [Branchiostoma belcheri]|uniref:C-type lectin domain family 10 member A-like n=1 Tax=Branchiostoma belcheri TaxID=7741 RepID=A0A6P5A910_BRABE|nr:PREDICTED: C-type lectin domain family 10 member A-like [Branchiostoma belcheri]
MSQLSDTVDALKRNIDGISQLSDIVDALKRDMGSERNRTAAPMKCVGETVSSQQCPDDWRRHQRSCYLLVDTPETWRDAREDCHQLQADLASLTTADEQTYMGTQVVGGTYWFGLSDIMAEGDWQWVDGTDFDSAVTNWAQHEPNNLKKGEDCAQIWHNGRWNDQTCTNKHAYICEKRTGKALALLVSQLVEA